tara:strand:+ start:1237 stop:1449 length:213 start_codon:yes stop_codon:yes gene_type:complete
MKLIVSYKKDKSILRREIEIVSKGETVAELNKRPMTVERVKDEVYGKSKRNDVLILKITERKIIGYGVQD